MTASEAPERRRTPGLCWYDLVLEDGRPVPEHLRERRNVHGGDPARPGGALHQPSLARAGARPTCGARSGRWCAGRSTCPRSAATSCTTSRGLLPRRPHPRREHQGVRERVPAPWSGPQGRGRPLQRVPLLLPRLHLEARRLAALRARRRRVPRDPGRPRRLATPRGEGRHVGRLRLPQPGPGAEPLGGLPRRPAGALPAVGLRRPLPAGACRQAAALQLEGGAGGVRRGSAPGRRRTRSRRRTSGTATTPWTSTATTPARSARPARPRTTCRSEPEERDILARMLDVREGEELPIPFSAAHDRAGQHGRGRA